MCSSNLNLNSSKVISRAASIASNSAWTYFWIATSSSMLRHLGSVNNSVRLIQNFVSFSKVDSKKESSICFTTSLLFTFSNAFAIFSPRLRPSYFLRSSSLNRVILSWVRFFCCSFVMPKTFPKRSRICSTKLAPSPIRVPSIV